MKRTGSGAVRAVVTLLLLAGLGAGGLGVWRAYATAAPRFQFRTSDIERGELVASIAATGTLEPEEIVDIGAQVAGIIQEFGRDPNDSTRHIDYLCKVEEGTVLAKIDESLYKTQVEQARANLQMATAELQTAQAQLRQRDREYKRARDLGPRRAISDLDADMVESNFETARGAVAKAEAMLSVAKASLSTAEVNLGYTTIRSPVKGIIIDRRVNIGQTVVASLNAPSLFLIAKDLTRMQIWASVNEADIGRIYDGQRVQFSVDAFPGEEFDGVVSQIRLNATMTQNVVTYTVVVAIDNRDGRLKPYLTADVHFEVGRKDDALMVPNSALRWFPQPDQVSPSALDDYLQLQQLRTATGRAGSRSRTVSLPVVWVEDGEGRVRPIRVTVGITDGLHTEVSGADLDPNLKVVTGGGQRLSDRIFP